MNIDVNWDYNCLALGREGITHLVEEAASAGIRQINFRVSNKGALNYRTRVGTSYHERLDAYGAAFDPLVTFIEAAHRRELRACIWLDLFEGCYDEYLQDHPHFNMQARDGQPGMMGVPAFCCPEVCTYYLSLLEEWLPLQPDAVLFCTKSAHVPKNFTGRREMDCGYNLPALERYRKKLGNGPVERENLAELHGEYLIEFFRLARRRLNDNGIELSLALPANGVPLNGTAESGINIRLDWRKIVACQCVDTIALTNNRHEAYLLYRPEGRAMLAEAREFCAKNNVTLQAYVFSNEGIYSDVEKQVGLTGVLKFIPLHLTYLRDQCVDGVLFHDLDLLHVEPWYRRIIWQAVGAAAHDTLDATKAWLGCFGETFDGQVPETFSPRVISNDFIAIPPLHRDKHTPPGNYSMEFSSDRLGPYGWGKCVPADNEKLFAEYDWKVMHNDARSGRTFSGRSSVLLGGESGAGLHAVRRVSWDAAFAVPMIPDRTDIRVWAHGEGLIGVESAGMSVTILTPEGEVQETLSTMIPDSPTFPWTEFCLRHSFQSSDTRVHVSLFLQFHPIAASEGRLWFDEWEIVPVDEQTSRIVLEEVG